MFKRNCVFIYIAIKWLCFVNENSRRRFAFELLNKERVFIYNICHAFIGLTQTVVVKKRKIYRQERKKNRQRVKNIFFRNIFCIYISKDIYADTLYRYIHLDKFCMQLYIAFIVQLKHNNIS